MFGEFDNYLKMMTVAFPKMRFVNAGEGGKIVNDWRASEFRHDTEEGSYTVAELNPEESLSDNQYWFLFASHENSAKIESQLRNESVPFSKTAFMDGYLYNAYTAKPTLTLRDLKYRNQSQILADNKIIKKVKSDYKRYLATVNKFIASGFEKEWVDETDKIYRLELAALQKDGDRNHHRHDHME